MGSPLPQLASPLVDVHMSLLKAGAEARDLSLPAVILLWIGSFAPLTTEATGGGLVKIA